MSWIDTAIANQQTSRTPISARAWMDDERGRLIKARGTIGNDDRGRPLPFTGLGEMLRLPAMLTPLVQRRLEAVSRNPFTWRFRWSGSAGTPTLDAEGAYASPVIFGSEGLAQAQARGIGNDVAAVMQTYPGHLSYGVTASRLIFDWLFKGKPIAGRVLVRTINGERYFVHPKTPIDGETAFGLVRLLNGFYEQATRSMVSLAPGKAWLDRLNTKLFWIAAHNLAQTIDTFSIEEAEFVAVAEKNEVKLDEVIDVVKKESKEVIKDAAGAVGEALAWAADTAGEAAGRGANKFLKEAGLPALIVVGALVYGKVAGWY